MAPTSSDEDLAIAFAGHKRWAFGEAYRRYAALLYSAAYNILYNGEDAEDCVSETIARLWRAPRPYSTERGSLRSFLVVCVRNEAISRQRRRLRRARLEERLAAMRSDRDDPAFADPIERDRVRSALRALPGEQRAALELAYYGGRTQSEVAAELNEPLGTIKSRMKLGLQKLAAALSR